MRGCKMCRNWCRSCVRRILFSFRRIFRVSRSVWICRLSINSRLIIIVNSNSVILFRIWIRLFWVISSRLWGCGTILAGSNNNKEEEESRKRYSDLVKILRRFKSSWKGWKKSSRGCKRFNYSSRIYFSRRGRG